MHTQVCVVGTVATDPKLTQSAGKSAFCSFRLACNERRYDAEKKEWVDSETSFYSVNSFRGLADHAVRSFSKGDRVIVSGKLRVREWSNGEKAGISVVVEAEALGHDLRWGTSQFTRAASNSQPDPAPGEQTDALGTSTATNETTDSWADVASAARATAGLGDASQANDSADESVASQFEADGFTPRPEYTAV